MAISTRTVAIRYVAGRAEERSPDRAVSTIITLLAALIVTGALVAALAGLFWQSGDGPTTVMTPRGETVELYGQGIYQHDSTLKGAGNRGSDVVTLAIAIPMLIVSLALYRRGSLRGGLVFMGTLVWFLYLYTTLAVGATYNNLFLLYVAIFSASLFAFILTFRVLATYQLGTKMPRRGPAAFMFASGAITLGIWLMAPVGALFSGNPPDGLETGSTLVTHALDIAIIVPAAILAGVLILRRVAMGYLIAFSLLVLEALLAPLMAAQTAFQLAADVSFTTAVVVVVFGGFAVLSLFAILVLVALLRRIEEPAG